MPRGDDVTAGIGEAKETIDAAGQYVLPGGAMEDLAVLIAGFHPEKWEDLPDREYFALDAPDRRIEVKYGDGTEYTVNDDKETEGPLFRELEDFMRSYPAEN